MEFVVGILVAVNIINMIIEIILFIKYISLYDIAKNMCDDIYYNLRDIRELERRLDCIENPPKDQGEHNVN